MGYYFWHKRGYGICVSALEVHAEGLKELLALAPLFNVALSDGQDNDPELYQDLSTILKEVILESEGITLTDCDDMDGRQYLLYEPSYPWELSDKEKALTESEVSELINRYASVLTGRRLKCEYFSV